MYHIWLRIEVDAVGYPDEHVAVNDSVVLGHTYSDVVTSRVYHGLEMARRFDPVVDGVLGGIGCPSEYGQVITEAVGAAGVEAALLSSGEWCQVQRRLEQAWAAFIRASLTGSSETPLALRVWLMSRIISCRISRLSVRLILSPLDGISEVVGVAELIVSVMLPHSPALLEAVISAVPSALAMTTQKAGTCSTATVSGPLEMTVYSVPLGPMM